MDVKPRNSFLNSFNLCFVQTQLKTNHNFPCAFPASFPFFFLVVDKHLDIILILCSGQCSNHHGTVGFLWLLGQRRLEPEYSLKQTRLLSFLLILSNNLLCRSTLDHFLFIALQHILRTRLCFATVKFFS